MEKENPNSRQKGPGFLSVTCVAVCIATTVIIIAVAIILAVTLTYSLRAADEFAESYSQNSVSAAQNKVNDFVTTPIIAFTNMQSATDIGILPNVINVTDNTIRAQIYTTYLSHFQPMMFGAAFNLLYIATGLADRSWISCSVKNKITFLHTCSYNNPITSTVSNSTSKTYSQNGTIVASGVTASTYDPRTRSWYINAPKTRNSFPVFSAVYVDSSFGVPVVDLNGPLFSQDGSFMGVTSITLDLRQIASFLASMPRTTNGFTALVDAEGFMLGGSDVGDLSKTTRYNASTDGALPAGCGSFSNTTDGTVSKVCRLSPATYSSPIFRELASKEPGMLTNDQVSTSRKIKLGGEQWMVSKAPITAKTDVTEATISWQIFTLMPVSDVTGPIIVGRNAGIAVARVMVVVSSVACGIALYVLLHPLAVLSELMEQAAELKELGVTMDKSSMREIRAIQDSFERLSAQLKKAKSFLPAAILAQLESSGDDEEEEGEATKAGGVSCVTSTQDAKTTMSSNHRSRAKGIDTYSSTQLASTMVPKKIISSNVSLAHRSVTVCSLNLRYFHRNTLEHSAGLESSYGKLVDEYQRIAKEHRGIMDSFHGDRFIFTFNTVRPCTAHASMAATAMLKIVASMEHHAPGSTSVMGSAVTCGVATGRCLVGNLGSDKAKRYTVIGPAFSHATVLERLCKRYPNTSVLLSAETSKDCETHIGLLYMDVIDGPGRKAVPIAAAKYLKESAKHTTADSEWMYEMETHNTVCDYHPGNRAFLYALHGDGNSAQTHLSAFKDKSEESEFARSRIAELIKGRPSAELGLFYDRCVLDAGSKSVWTAQTDDSTVSLFK